MRLKPVTTAIVTALLVCTSFYAQAASIENVTEILGNSVMVFSDGGDFVKEIKKQDFLQAYALPLPILATNDNLGLLKVDGKDGPIWIGEDGLKTSIDKKSVIDCTKAPKVKVADTVTAAAMGLSACTK